MKLLLGPAQGGNLHHDREPLGQGSCTLIVACLTLERRGGNSILAAWPFASLGSCCLSSTSASLRRLRRLAKADASDAIAILASQGKGSDRRGARLRSEAEDLLLLLAGRMDVLQRLFEGAYSTKLRVKWQEDFLMQIKLLIS